MRIAFASDERYPVHAEILAELRRRGHDVVGFGVIDTGHGAPAEAPWAEMAEAAALAVASGACDEAIVACWTGTGASIAANKVTSVRAALCTDPQTAAAARVWNHANALCLSNRLLSGDLAREILAAWFDTEPGDRGADGVARLAAVEARGIGARGQSSV